jgi:hypothetical protein
MKIRILESAIQDLLQGYQFYEQQEKGLGGYFIDSLFSDIDSLQVYAGIHSIHFKKYRLLSKRFPFAVYYTLQNNDVVLVHAVLDCRQDSFKTSNRLK